MIIHKHFREAITLRNMFFMVKSTVVRGRLLFLLATVLEWQRAVNRQPGSRARTRRAGALSSAFFQKNAFFKKISKWHHRGKFHADRTLRFHWCFEI